MSGRIAAAVLGATGLVGRRLVALLSRHPWFCVGDLAASERSAGRRYGEAAGLAEADLPREILERALLPPGAALASRLVFSALDAAAARELEPLHAGRGHLVVSNASAFRLDPRVPLLVPEINPESLRLLPSQRWAAAGGGILTNPNCVVAGLTLALSPLQERWGIESAVVVTLQALSGAGLPGVPALEALGNVIPYIPGEEEKIEREPEKILGARFPISAAVHRVPVPEGHCASVFVRLAERARPDEIAAELRRWRGKTRAVPLPSAPERPVLLRGEEDRPQPRRDLEAGGGMSVVVGRLRGDARYDARFELLVHNTLRGAAGGALLNAELLAAEGIVEAPSPLAAVAR